MDQSVGAGGGRRLVGLGVAVATGVRGDGILGGDDRITSRYEVLRADREVLCGRRR